MSISFWEISSYWAYALLLNGCQAPPAEGLAESWSLPQALHQHTFIKHSGIYLPDYCAYTTV